MKTISGCCLAFVLLTALSCGGNADLYDVTIPNLKILPEESIVSFEITVNAGSITSIRGIPVGWNAAVEDDVSWRSRVKATATAGAASLSSDELKRLVFVVRRNETADFKFDLAGMAVVTKSLENPKKMPLVMGDFALAGTSE